MKHAKTFLATVLLLSSLVIPTKAAYYVYGNGGDYEGKLNLWMDGSTRWGVAGTYIPGGYIVNTIRATLTDNGVTKGYASKTMDDDATTQTKVVNYSGVTSKHEVISPNHGNWTGYN